MTRLTELNFPNPVETQNDLFDRERELEMIQQILISPLHRPVVIKGERRMGKTSLLNIVIEWAGRNDGFVVLQVPHVASRDKFIEEVLDGLAAEAGTSLHRLGYREQGRLRVSTGVEFVRVARELSGSLAGRQLLLCLDELDSMLKDCGDDAAKEILGFILFVVQSDLPIKFLSTLTRMPEAILHSDPSVFSSHARFAELPPWTTRESREYVDKLLQGVVTLDENAYRELYAAGGGHPYLTKAVLQALVEITLGLAEAGHATAGSIDAAVTVAVTLPEVDGTLANIITAHFSDDEARILRGVARADTGELDASELEHSPEAVHNLVNRGYLRVDADGRHTHAYGLLAEWIRSRRWSRSPRKLPPVDDTPRMVVDGRRGRVFVGDDELKLTAQEYSFLNCLADNLGSVVDRYTIATAVWPRQVVDGVREGRIDALVSRLRTKLGRENSEKYIETRTGRGYYLNPDHVRREPG